MLGISTLNDSYARLCRAIISNAFEDAYNIKYENDIRQYITSGNLEVDCFLAKLTFDLVEHRLLEILAITHETAQCNSHLEIIN